MDELIYQAKKGIIEYYNESKFQIEIDCQEVLEGLRKRNKDTKEALKQFEDLIAKNESIFEEAMKSLNDSIQSAQELIKRHIQSTIYFKRTDLRSIENADDDEDDSNDEEDGSSDEEEQVGVEVDAQDGSSEKEEEEDIVDQDDGEDDSINEEETMDQEEDGSSNEEEDNKKFVGVFVHANWFLSANQVNFIKLKLLKEELTKDIQLSLDEVTLERIFYNIEYMSNLK